MVRCQTPSLGSRRWTGPTHRYNRLTFVNHQLHRKRLAVSRLFREAESHMNFAETVIRKKNTTAIAALCQTSRSSRAVVDDGDTRVAILGVFVPLLSIEPIEVSTTERNQTASTTDAALVTIPSLFRL